MLDYIGLYSGKDPEVIAREWSAKTIDRMLIAYVENRFDFNGWQKAGMIAGMILNPHLKDISGFYHPEQWARFVPRAPRKQISDNGDLIRKAMEARYK